jgi:hypothetical protein
VRITERRFPRAAQTAGALLLYLAFAVFLTWPLVLHLGSSAYMVTASPHGGDMGGSTAQLRELVQHHQNPFLQGRLHDFAAPEGQEIRWALNVATFPSTSLLYILALCFGATAAYGLFVLGGYVASGTAMFLLARKLTGSPWIGGITGWAFAFYPFAVVTGEHPNFIHGWVFVVMLWRFLRLIEEPTKRQGLYFGAATILAMTWTQYFIMIGGIAFAALLVSLLAVAAFRRETRLYAAPLSTSVAVVVPFVLMMRSLLLASGAESTLPQNVLADVLNTSARLPMYFVPPAHHVLGGLTAAYLNAHHLNAVEWTLYLGITTVVLAVAGVMAAVLRRLEPVPRTFTLVVCSSTIVAFLFSFPPRTSLFGTEIYLPSELIFATSSSWRLYTRFVIVVMAGVACLAAVGLSWLTQGRSRRATVAILGAATLLVPTDLWDRPPDHIYRFEADPIYRVLGGQPAGGVAEYPLRSVGHVGDYLDTYYQDAHGRPILNGYFAGAQERRALALHALNDPATAGHLATLGVRYVVLTPWRIGPDAPDPGKPTNGFRFLARDAYASLYRVTAPPQPFVYEQDGFWGPEGKAGNQFQWAGEAPVRLGIIAPCSSCTGLLRFDASSLGRPRTVGLRTSDGRTLRSIPVGVSGRPVIFPLHFRHRTVVELLIAPGPQSIAETLGNSDPRRVSVMISDLRFVPTSQR